MIVVDASDGTPTDIVDASDGTPTDLYISLYMMAAQVTTGMTTPTFTAVDTTEVINPEPGLLLYVRVGATSVQVTVTVPGTQPYTGVDRDDLVAAGLQNTERIFYMPALLTDPLTEVATVSYLPATDVTAALLKVG
jgi:hypothetical protein